MESSQKLRSVKYVNGSFSLHEEDLPQPGKGQALIKVHFSTVNPYDRIMSGVNKDEGFVLGCDGCGIIEQVGEDVDQSLVGKKVAFLGGGWANYAVKDVDFLVFFRDDFDLKNGANTYVNPFTVTAMLDYAKKLNAKAIVLLAASSALCKMLIRLAQKEGIDTVAIVRKDENVKELKEEYGVKYTLNQTSATFDNDLTEAIKEAQPTVLFECVGGDLAGEVFLKMPHKSHMVVYGNLTKQKVTFEPQEFHWADKQIHGLMMFRWVCSLTKEERKYWFDYVADDLYNGGKLFGSKIVKEVNLDGWKEFIKESEDVASLGKYLVKCQPDA